MKPVRLTAVSLAALLLPLTALAAPATPPRVIENPVLRVEVSGRGRPMVFVPGLTCGGDV